MLENTLSIIIISAFFIQTFICNVCTMYLDKGLSKFIHHQTVDQDIGRGVEDEENMRHEAEDDDPGGKPAQVRVLATENKSRVKF